MYCKLNSIIPVESFSFIVQFLFELSDLVTFTRYVAKKIKTSCGNYILLYTLEIYLLVQHFLSYSHLSDCKYNIMNARNDGMEYYNVAFEDKFSPAFTGTLDFQLPN